MLSKRLRFEILRRDNHTCRYCGRAAPDVKLTVDHVQPVTLGGKDDPANLVAACADCNAGKSSIPVGSALVADIANDALKWAQALKDAAWYRAQERELVAEVIDKIGMAWKVWTITVNVDGEDVRHHLPRPDDWLDSVRRLYLSGLDPESMIEFIGMAMRRPGVANEDKWTYFCGCCWREIDEIQDLARDMARADERAEADAGSPDGS